jgi:hypothetical protein
MSKVNIEDIAKRLGGEVRGLYFDKNEIEILRELLQFLNQSWATFNYTHQGNQPSPNFIKGRLSAEEAKIFWEKLGL